MATCHSKRTRKTQVHSANTFTPGHSVGELNTQVCWGLSNSSILPLVQAGVLNDLFFLFLYGRRLHVALPARLLVLYPGRTGAGCWYTSGHRWAQGAGASPPGAVLLPTGTLQPWGQAQKYGLGGGRDSLLIQSSPGGLSSLSSSSHRCPPDQGSPCDSRRPPGKPVPRLHFCPI